MRILITGGAGFIGSHLVDYYVKNDDEVVVIDNLLTGVEENIRQHYKRDNFRFVNQDVCNVYKFQGDFDLILHLACPASPVDYLEYPIETLRVLSFGTYSMLELARTKNAVFLLASTSEVYGDPQVHPQKEDYFGNVSLISPRAVYDEGKRFAEALTFSYYRKYNLSVRIVRIFNTYGERMRSGDGRVVPTFISNALNNKALPIFGDGSQTRSFCHVEDMVQGIVKAAQKDYPMPINLGNPLEYTILQLADIVKRLCGSNSEYKFLPLPDADPKKRRPDISRAKEVLKWQPEINLEEGLKRTIKWLRRKHG